TSCRPRYSVSSSTVMPSTPGAPLFALTCCNAFLRLPASQIFSIIRSVAGLSVAPSAISDSVPLRSAVRASPSGTPEKASSNWIFCRCSLMSRASYSPPLIPFGPSLQPWLDFDEADGVQLLCPLLTSAPRSCAFRHAQSSLGLKTRKGHDADLPR